MEKANNVIAILEVCDINVKVVRSGREHLRKFQAPVHRINLYAHRFGKRECRFDLERLSVCNLGFNVMGENNMMFFNLGEDASCTNLLKSKKFKTRATPNSVAYTDYSNFTLIENEENMGPLSLTLASSLAMLAINNNMPVDIIYKQVDSIYFNGIKLLSIKLLNINGTTNP